MPLDGKHGYRDIMSDRNEVLLRVDRLAAVAQRLTLHWGPATLADRVFPRGFLTDIVLVLCGGAIIAVSAQVVVPLWPVPSTGQIVGILLVAMALGPSRGVLAVLVYLAMGASGLPVFNMGGAGWNHLVGPTGGYLFGFILAAAVGGTLALKQWDRSFGRSLAAAGLATAIVYACGVPWLATVGGYSFEKALSAGLLTLLPGGVVKALLVALLTWAAWRQIDRLDERSARLQGTTV